MRTIAVNHVERVTIERIDATTVPAPERVTFLFRCEADLCKALRAYLARCTANHFTGAIA